MSSLQTGIGSGWGDDGFEWPEWLDGYSDPVVRTGAKSRKKMHAPDLRADEKQPACVIGRRDTEQLFVVTEKANLEGFYSECGRPECREWFEGDE